MKGERQRAIAEFFGEATQILKAHEEMDEINQALEEFCNNQNIITLEHLLFEVNDLVNVLEGLYIQMGGKLDKILTEKEHKLFRTIGIINKIPLGVDKVKAYEEIRRSHARG